MTPGYDVWRLQLVHVTRAFVVADAFRRRDDFVLRLSRARTLFLSSDPGHVARIPDERLEEAGDCEKRD